MTQPTKIMLSILLTSLLLITSLSTLADNPKEDNYFSWEDDFETSYNIDPVLTSNIEATNGSAQFIDTIPAWTNPAYTRMKPITITNNAGQTLTNQPIQLTLSYDSDMQSDYSDLRFKHADEPTLELNYWIEASDPIEAIVWVLIPTIPEGDSILYLFYGNSGVNSQSDFYSVFTNWEEHWANDEQLSYHDQIEGAWDPDVCYGQDVYLVAWEEGQSFSALWLYKQEIRASIFDTDGNVQNFDFLIYKDSSTPYRNENPSIAYGDNTFFVAFENYYNPLTTTNYKRNIKAKLVSPTGSVGSTITVATYSTSEIAADPCVAFDSTNEQFAVVWEDARMGTSNYNIYAKLYDTSGNLVGSEKSIATGAKSQSEPWIAYDEVNDHYIIVWEEGTTPDTGPFDIYAGIFDSSLNQLWSGQIAQGSSSTDHCFPCCCFTPVSQQYLITWNTCDISSDDYYGDVYGKILDTSGGIIADTFLIRGGSFARTDIQPYLSDSFFVSYDGYNSIYGKLISSDGSITGTEIQLSASTSSEADWANIAVHQDQIFVAWEDTRIAYTPPWDGMPDTYANIWELDIPDSNQVTITIHSEHQQILDGQLTSIPIEPENIEQWSDFFENSTGTITYDILNADATEYLFIDVPSGYPLNTIDPEQYPAIRLQAHFTRQNPSTSPLLDSWGVHYVGSDSTPPRTTLDHIDGTQGQNNYYTSSSVTVYLNAEDLPQDTGIGINHTYYTLDSGSPEIYNDNTGIILATSQQNNWMGNWEINFWSIDKAGNEEDKTNPNNYVTINIDSEVPYVSITEPQNEEQVNLPFWVRADASDNAEIDRVEFDIEPFGQRPGLPYVDYEAPYEWYCDISPSLLFGKGTNLMIRAQVYDVSGQTWSDEHWIYIENMGEGESFDNTYCILIATGDPSDQTIGIQAFNFLKDITWEFDSGLCISVGMSGTYSIDGYHTGEADNFIGLYNEGLIIGVAKSVHVEQ